MIHPARQRFGFPPAPPSNASYSEDLPLRASRGMEFLDITDSVKAIIARSSVSFGMVNIQTHLTTAAVLVNENESLLLQDLEDTLDRLAPASADYRHDDLSIRTENLVPNEPENGHAHCKALFLPPSILLNMYNRELQLGQWQRIFFLELDRPRNRTVSIQVLGL